MSKKYVILIEHGRTAPNIMNRPDSERPQDQKVTENYNNYKYIIIIIVVLEWHINIIIILWYIARYCTVGI